MNKEAVFEQLKIDEGVVNEIYHDHLGYPTFGVGHLVLESDPEYGQEVGTPVEKKESKSVLKETSTQQYLSVSCYTKKGYLETYQTKSSKSWLIGCSIWAEQDLVSLRKCTPQS